MGCARLLCGTRCALSAAVVLAALLSLTAGALGDTQPVPPSAPAPWADPSHQSPLEVLASRIATHIAGKQVAIHCESDSDWSTVVTQAGGDPAGESGFVATQWNGATGQLLSLSTVAELSSGICGPLQQFASAAVKPTKCTVRHVALLAGRPAPVDRGDDGSQPRSSPATSAAAGTRPRCHRPTGARTTRTRSRS